LKYKALKNYWIEVSSGTDIVPGPNGSILIPPPNSKTFLHWLTDSGKISSTYTLEYSTLVTDKVKAISRTPIRIQVIDL
jgi:hypothetical protein